MDSPLEWVRRNQKFLLPVIGIAVILIFVLADSITKSLDNRVGSANMGADPQEHIVATWRDGVITDSELVNRAMTNTSTNSVLLQLYERRLLLANPLENDQNKFQMLVRQLQTMQANINQQNPIAPQGVLDVLLLEQAAAEMGIAASQQAAVEFINRLRTEYEIGSDGKPTGRATAQVSSSEMAEMIEREQKRNPGFNEQALLDNVRKLMLRGEVGRLTNAFDVYSDLAENATPLTRFAAYNRLKRTAAIQAVPLRVEDFVAQAPEPNPAELEKFFNEHKNRLPVPGGAEVGLMNPLRASFQWYTIKMEELKKSYRPRITNEEIAAYYEKNKDFYKKVTAPPDFSMPNLSVPKTDAPKTDAPTPPDAEKKTSQLPSRNLFQLTAFQADNKQPATTDKPAEDNQPTSDVKPAEGKSAESTKTSEAAAGTEPVKNAEVTNDKPADKATEADKKPTAPVEEYKSLAEVTDEIRATLADQAAFKKADELAEKLRIEMQAYARQRERAIRNAEETGKSTEFPEFNLETIRDKIDPTIECGRAVQITPESFRKLPLSEAEVFQRQRQMSLANFAYDEKLLPNYQVVVPSFSASGDRYVAWKTEQLAPSVPDWTRPEVKASVNQVWKTLEARKLAKKAAEEYAAMARKAGKPLKELFDEKQIPIAPSIIGRFSWMNRGIRNEMQVTKVSGIDSPGHDFMRTVFSLKAGEIGVAMNEPQTMVYVVQPTEIESPDDKRDTFLQEVDTRFGWGLFSEAGEEVLTKQVREFNKALRDRYGFKFNEKFKGQLVNPFLDN